MPPPPFDSSPTTQGGLRLPPFPQKKLSQLHMYDPPLNYMTPAQTKDALDAILEQLESFEEPPFTIQRLCELLLDPKRHYKSIGKYLRAVEKSILVTSSIDAFPPEVSSTSNGPANGTTSNNQPQSTPIAFATRSTPSTPLFSPIPFLHEDARIARSRSRSRSISPTRLDDRDASQPPPSPAPESEAGSPLLLSAEVPIKPNDIPEDDKPAPGLVDEMDDPRPGHLSEAPTPLTKAAGGKAIFASLQDRFVRSESKEDVDGPSNSKRSKIEDGQETMDLDQQATSSSKP